VFTQCLPLFGGCSLHRIGLCGSNFACSEVVRDFFVDRFFPNSDSLWGSNLFSTPDRCPPSRGDSPVNSWALGPPVRPAPACAPCARLGFPWVVLGFSLGFPWVFLGFSLGFPWVFLGFPWVFLGFSLGFLGFSLGFPWVFLGFSLGFPWGFLGFSLCFPWVFLGFSLGFPWVFLRFSLGFPWVFLGESESVNQKQ